MGCGKTTLGRAVALAASMRFIDLDEFIEEREGMTVRQIFDQRGEPYFRKLERDTLQEVAALENVIIATGGGTPCQPGLMEIMNRNGLTVYLETTTDVLHRRLLQGRATRPLIAKLDDDALLTFIEDALSVRSPHYEKAIHRFDSEALESAEQIERSVEKFTSQFVMPRS